MIYVDTSVALAHVLSEDRRPPDVLWDEELVSCRLLEYEAWTRIHSRKLGASHAEPLRLLLARFAFLELSRPVLARAVDPFPIAVRTLDALHLASIEFLRALAQPVELATYDRRMLAAAERMEIPLYDLP